MAVDYKKIGLVNTKEMFARAIKGGCISWKLWTGDCRDVTCKTF